MPDHDLPESATGRYLCVIDPQVTELEAAAAALESQGVTVEDRMEFLNTLVVRGARDAAAAAAKAAPGIRSIEPEGIVRPL